jgi:hypothetical protein
MFRGMSDSERNSLSFLFREAKGIPTEKVVCFVWFRLATSSAKKTFCSKLLYLQIHNYTAHNTIACFLFTTARCSGLSSVVYQREEQVYFLFLKNPDFV